MEFSDTSMGQGNTEFVNSFLSMICPLRLEKKSWQHCYILHDMLLEKLDHTMIELNVNI